MFVNLLYLFKQTVSIKRAQCFVKYAPGKALDLCQVGHNEAALVVLHEHLLLRKNRGVTPVTEPFMMKYVELAVSLNKNAKDGLAQYRYVCMTAVCEC